MREKSAMPLSFWVTWHCVCPRPVDNTGAFPALGAKRFLNAFVRLHRRKARRRARARRRAWARALEMRFRGTLDSALLGGCGGFRRWRPEGENQTSDPLGRGPRVASTAACGAAVRRAGTLPSLLGERV
eukprot:282822-Chlamydomonas_euryale.AAC.3